MEDPVTAAARIIHAAGLRHGWFGFSKPYDELDPIGRSKFEGIIQEALAAADRVRSEQKASKQ
jgi:hypothetical protein